MVHSIRQMIYLWKFWLGVIASYKILSYTLALKFSPGATK